MRKRRRTQVGAEGGAKRFAGGAAREIRHCAAARAAREVLRKLEIDEDLLDETHDRCYCGACAGADALPATMTAGGGLYEPPLGFVGFGIRLPARASCLNVFEDWHVSYHGLKAANVASVLLEGGLCLPGDTLLDGTTLTADHTRDPDGSRRQIYTSPSVRYAELPVYTEPDQRNDGGWTSSTKIVLQCRQKPGYAVHGETVAWERLHPGQAISPHFANSEIERTTRSRASVIPYRILVKIEEHTTVVWSGRTLGDCTVSRLDFSKCRQDEFFRADDAVRAVRDLKYGWRGVTIKQGSLGTLRSVPGGAADMTVEWADDCYKHAGSTTVSTSDVRKCEHTEFVKVGDHVKAAYDLQYSQPIGTVARGSLGRLVGMAPKWSVNWSQGRAQVEKEHVIKCKEHEFLQVGDAVKAARRLTYELGDKQGKVVEQGSLGTILDLSPLRIRWSGREGALSKAGANKDQLNKCQELDFCKVGDTVKADRDLSFTRGDEQGNLVKRGSLGRLVRM